jgi:hypothetical protein
MKKILTLLSSAMLLAGCVESIALLGPASGLIKGGNVVQSSVSSAVNLGIKKSTGKTPMQHALAYAEEKNPKKEKKRCISFIKKTNSEACAIAKKQIALTQAKLKEKTKSVLKKIPSPKESVFTKKANRTTVSHRGRIFAEARKEGKDSFIFNGKIYSTKLKETGEEKVIKPKKLTFVEQKNKNKNVIKKEKSAMELALDIQAALNKKN